MIGNEAVVPAKLDKATRNADRTRSLILEAATQEFAELGLAGARVEKIAEKAGTNKRMLYYYFNSKDELFIAVMERAYFSIREAEKELHMHDQTPIEAIRSLVSFTWNYFLEHPEFMGLLNTENAHGGVHVKNSESTALNMPLIDMIGEVLHRGQQESIFRAGVDPVQLYISIASLTYFYLSNKHTLSTIFSRDLMSSKAKVERLHHMLDVILGYLVIN
ncbi:TetR/AcrR family transcriptional regulator [Caballeronia sp. LP006]|uniref:TetR/AcrR family transcriptional regulator n=1 Tax=Caballeronia sp. LP006 TaxID=3038552 RepID=UPI00285649B2|nr:TetR/AcrR family transcriptional regulator [Caballeronia sp. LP006]MDR5832352.1 TetR/AcrR family transcriptional regulator [Caballeronia sp. LP006]